MRLSAYLKEAGISDTAFARSLKIASSTVHRLKNGDRQPSLDLALRIEAFTLGAVKPVDFRRTERTPTPQLGEART